MKNLDQMRVIVLTRIMSGPALENAQTKGDDPMGRFVLPCKAKHSICRAFHQFFKYPTPKRLLPAANIEY